MCECHGDTSGSPLPASYSSNRHDITTRTDPPVAAEHVSLGPIPNSLMAIAEPPFDATAPPPLAMPPCSKNIPSAPVVPSAGRVDAANPILAETSPVLLLAHVTHTYTTAIRLLPPTVSSAKSV